MHYLSNYDPTATTTACYHHTTVIPGHSVIISLPPRVRVVSLVALTRTVRACIHSLLRQAFSLSPLSLAFPSPCLSSLAASFSAPCRVFVSRSREGAKCYQASRHRSLSTFISISLARSVLLFCACAISPSHLQSLSPLTSRPHHLLFAIRVFRTLLFLPIASRKQQ